MGAFLVFVGLALFIIAIIALIRGRLNWARIGSRRGGLVLLGVSLVTFIIGGALSPQPETTTTATDAPSTSPPSSASPVPSALSVPPSTAVTTSAPTAAPTTAAPATPSGPVPGAPADVRGPYQVAEVVDGDTYRIQGDEGEVAVRLIGVDTPETRDPGRPVECYGKEATEMARQLLTSEQVWVSGDPSQDAQDRYDRELAYIWLEDGTLVNRELVRIGAGIEYTYETPYQRQDEFRAAEDEARSAQRGLWSPATCDGDPDLPAEQETTQAPAPAPAPEAETETEAERPASPAPRATQAPAPAPAPEVEEDDTESGNGGGAIYFENCKEARAAGAAPLQRGDPGYREGLDRDNDGVACET